MVLTLDRALEAPSGVFGVPVEFALPVTLVAMLLTAIVVLFYLAVRGSEPGDRLDTLRAFVLLVGALGDVVRGCLEAVARIFSRQPPSDL